jgi:hypothetical protein
MRGTAMEGAREVRHTKILIPSDMPVKEIMEKHKVCNTTAYNAMGEDR